MINLKDFIAIETYEDCPVDEELLVWTGDSFDIEYVDFCCEEGVNYPANGVEFTHYQELPSQDVAMKYFEEA